MKIVSKEYDNTIDWLQDYEDPRTFVRKSEVYHIRRWNTDDPVRLSDRYNFQTAIQELVSDKIRVNLKSMWDEHKYDHIPELRGTLVCLFDRELDCVVNVQATRTLLVSDKPTISDFTIKRECASKQPVLGATCLDILKDLADKNSANPNIQEKMAWFLLLGSTHAWDCVITNPPMCKFPWLLEDRSAERLFQDVETFLWRGVDISPQEPVPNKVKVESHGFDNKTSFRKEKQK